MSLVNETETETSQTGRFFIWVVGVQSHFHVNPNLSFVELRLSSGFDN